MRVGPEIIGLGKYLSFGTPRRPNHANASLMRTPERSLQRMVHGAIAGACHHNSLDTFAQQCVNHGGSGAGMAENNFHHRPHCGVSY